MASGSNPAPSSSTSKLTWSSVSARRIVAEAPGADVLRSTVDGHGYRRATADLLERRADPLGEEVGIDPARDRARLVDGVVDLDVRARATQETQ
jgi:hypothetical protein